MPDFRPAAALSVLFITGLLIVLLNQCSRACAEDTEDTVPAAVIPPLKPGKLLTIGGERGRWWPLETAILLAEEHEGYARLKELYTDSEALVGVLTERIIEKDRRILRLQEIERTSDERAKIAETAIRTAETRRREAEESERRARSWWRHPVFWCVVGAAASSTAVGLAMRDK